MPQIFRMGEYRIYFWSNEGEPLEPLHFHISKGKPSKNATKVWMLKDGSCKLVHNNSKIPEKTLKNIIETMESMSDRVKNEWIDFFGSISYIG